jgi:predicted ATPase/Tfp pilus assembly protein PilF
MLLVLDNFEQLARDAARLQDLLEGCPRVKLIVTSRVRLGLRAEWSLPLEGMGCPDPEDTDRIDAFDAARLFVKAARRVQPSFAPAADAAAIVDICRLVEGMPLALELAAAWVRVLPCDAIAAELRRGTELLHAADPARGARHAGIDVIFDQSWHYLGSAERKALAWLSVFRGGLTAESARTVAAAPLPVLGALADRSLLRKEGSRLHLHPLVQQLAARRFDDDLARVAAHDAHAAHFLALLGQLRGAVQRGEREALQRVDAEFENCRAAWRWSAQRGHVEPLAGAAATLLDYCDHRGRLEDGLSMLQHALDAPAALADRPLHALLTSRLAHLQYRLDRYAEAQATASRALEASRLIPRGPDAVPEPGASRTRQRAARAQSLVVLGACALRLGQLDDARRCFRQAQRLAASGTDPHRSAALLDNMALVEKAAGRYEEALRLSNASLLEYRRMGHAAGEALCLNNLGTQLVDQGDYVQGEARLREALALCERHGIATTRTLVLANFTELAIKTGDLDAAQRHGARALDAAKATGNRFVAAWLRQQLAHIAVLHGDGNEARAQLAESLAAQGFGRASLLLNGAICFARLLAAEGRREAARQVLTFAIAAPGMAPLQRDEALALLAEWGGPACDWPGWTLDELTHRIVAERDVQHAPLIAGLRGGVQVA